MSTGVTGHSTAAHWDTRFAGDAYYYGTEPNELLRAQASALPAGGDVLCLGEGEGRNAVFLASLGFRVLAVDLSTVGLRKAQALARERGVVIDTAAADVTTYPLGESRWDGIVSIWCHLPRNQRRDVHERIVRALRPGGAYVLEAYTPDQLRFGTGGPKDLDLLPTLADLRAELVGLVFEHAVERECEIHEGAGHHGRSAVVDLVGRRPR